MKKCEECGKLINPGDTYIYHCLEYSTIFCSHKCADKYDRRFRSEVIYEDYYLKERGKK